MRSFFSLCLGVCSLVLAGCGGDPEEIGAALGEACDVGKDCKTGLFCFVATEGGPGECREIPASCGETAMCKQSCFDDIKAECVSGHECTSLVGGSEVTLICKGGTGS